MIRVLARKVLKRGGGLRSKDICGFSNHIKYIWPQKGGREGLPPSLARSLMMSLLYARLVVS